MLNYIVLSNCNCFIIFIWTSSYLILPLVFWVFFFGRGMLCSGFTLASDWGISSSGSWWEHHIVKGTESKLATYNARPLHAVLLFQPLLSFLAKILGNKKHFGIADKSHLLLNDIDVEALIGYALLSQQDYMIKARGAKD